MRASTGGVGKWTRVLIDATVNWELEPEEQYGGKREPPFVHRGATGDRGNGGCALGGVRFCPAACRRENGQDRGVRDGFEQTRRGAPSLPGESTQIRDAAVPGEGGGLRG